MKSDLKNKFIETKETHAVLKRKSSLTTNYVNFFVEDLNFMISMTFYYVNGIIVKTPCTKHKNYGYNAQHNKLYNHFLWYHLKQGITTYSYTGKHRLFSIISLVKITPNYSNYKSSPATPSLSLFL